MRVFKTKWFRRFARREGIVDAALCDAVVRVHRGQIDADLGGGVLKQRVARAGQGRSGGYRTLIVYRARDRAIFVFGFAKSERENLEPGELGDEDDGRAAPGLHHGATGRGIAERRTRGSNAMAKR